MMWDDGLSEAGREARLDPVQTAGEQNALKRLALKRPPVKRIIGSPGVCKVTQGVLIEEREQQS